MFLIWIFSGIGSNTGEINSLYWSSQVMLQKAMSVGYYIAVGIQKSQMRNNFFCLARHKKNTCTYIWKRYKGWNYKIKQIMTLLKCEKLWRFGRRVAITEPRTDIRSGHYCLLFSRLELNDVIWFYPNLTFCLELLPMHVYYTCAWFKRQRNISKTPKN